MNVVLDTNVYISALVFPGGMCDQIIRLARLGKIKIYTSPDILTEFKKVLTKKFKFTEDEAVEITDRIIAVSELIYPRFRIDIIEEAESDNRILECVEEAQADFLVTGDKKHILPLKRFKETRIVTPNQFLEIALR